MQFQMLTFNHNGQNGYLGGARYSKDPKEGGCDYCGFEVKVPTGIQAAVFTQPVELQLMARRSTPAPPAALVLNADQIRRRIDVFKRCITQLEAFNPETVQKRFGIPEVIALETQIKDALASAFGPGTPRYNRFENAANLDNGPVTMRMAPAFGRGHSIDYDARDAHEARLYLTEGKGRSIDLLLLAIQSLEDDLADLAPSTPAPMPAAPAPGDKVFLVHGRDDIAKNAVDLFLRTIGLDPIILHLKPNGGRDLLTKFREEAAGAGFAVVLMTPDDEGGIAGAGDNNPRARQNVVFELGFFIGKLGPANVVALVKGDVERPSDFNGIVYISYDDSGQWKTLLARELHHAKVPFDAAKAFSA
jgi:predicted nucleotide-binding protein